MKDVLDWLTLKDILDWLTLKNIQKFLGLVNYYWQFIKDFIAIARLLHDMMKKNQKWDQIEKQKEAFQMLKEKFTKELVLTVPDLDKKMRIEVNVLDYATRGVLFMKYKDGRQRPVAFLSKSLNETERNYKIHDKEMLAVIRELENWRHLLEGTKFKFKVQIDHKNLEYFIKVQKLNRR